MGEKEALIQELEYFKEKISGDFKLDKLILFGSFARNNFSKDSDADLIVVSPVFGKEKSWKRSKRLYKHWRHRFPVDFLCFTPEEFRRKKKSVSIVTEAVKEGLEI